MVITRLNTNSNELSSNNNQDLITNFMNLEPVHIMPSLELLRNKTSVIINNEGDDCKCPICLESINNNEICRVINTCGHKFHINCIDTWFEKNIKCPICRIDLRDVDTTIRNEQLVSDNENINGTIRNDQNISDIENENINGTITNITDYQNL